ncbi:LuxR C-terminal-related transcriptional regulator [Flaviramulus sp. BrNp1-15]|uniref:helix-turn-helix and ligand-binding sensor domain-containing protein n=1 Tax=Flaviramulus sp. BrNp1-15 TaxID=2916754 RepID=UPI001EE91041|nr:triple tyrosine motif-containing protein [Flaviramulus sp. BrNp1-15]ULC58439.1 LuxR C-terminal-related transcriptional regulator [Flaviramulus sp. BrNp1-15]
MRLIKYIIFSLILLTQVTLLAQERPPIEIFSTEDYGAETQNWSIAQSKEKHIYAANNKGLLEYNGANWQLYLSPNETILRSVNVIDELIYTGANSEFGYWQRNEFGLLFYISLSQALKIDFLEDEEFWNIVSIDDYILFQSLKRIYIYSKTNNSYEVIDSETIIYKIFKVDNSIYFQKTKDGIYKIENGEAKLVSNHPIVQNNRLVNIFSKDEKLLIETENNGFYILENDSLAKWEISANNVLSQISVFRSIQLKDKSFILGTRSSGVLHLTQDGKIDYNINNIHGLSNNTVHWAFEDAENNIWLALENGINCVNIKSPFRIYKDNDGKIGTVHTSIVYNNNLYLGSNQGLFYKQLDSDEDFKLVDNIQEAVWCLVEIDNALFCGHDTGTSIVNNNTSEKINGIQQGTWSIRPIDGRNDLLLQGNYDGLYVLQKINNQWNFRNKIQGFDRSSKFFEIFDNHIFVSHEYNGVFKIEVNDDFNKALEVNKITSIDKGLNSSLIKYKGDLLYTFKEGVFKYDFIKNEFAKDSILSKLFKREEYTSGKLLFEDKTNTLWSFSKNDLNYLTSSSLSSNPKLNNVPFSKSLPRGLTGYENISHLKNKQYLIGSSTGFVLMDIDKIQKKSYDITINSVSKNSINSSPEIVDKSTTGFFKNKYNNVEFTYSVVEYEKYLDTEYQYLLEGIYGKWSDWSSNPIALFKNLPHGDYTFKVRARVGNTLTNNIASYSFNIENPWYLTKLMIALYALMVLLFSLFMHNVYKRYYRKQREKLLNKTKNELELKELENRQQLMRFNNDKLRQDIENKNRELGISTMSLIKKNEFLNTIKKELQNAEDKKSIKNVIKIIDRNLNNADDWHVFEEAFNNADKDFLKKIKHLHPSLTSNDLRLCAYLRLNLSSKEIAPLLNISPRSVEVKRYRLRKKMDLPHESSLTDYILDI